VLSLGLGSSVVTPLELATAFTTFASGGVRVEPFGVTRVEDLQGKVLESHVPRMEEAISPQLAYLITHLLKAVVQGGTGHGAARLKRPVAGKTGTTNDHRDLWFVGYTPDLLAAAWMGYDDFSSLGGNDWTGGTTVVPWWTNIMEKVLQDYPPRDFPVPDDIITLAVDADTGLLALPTCPKRTLQAYLKGTEPKEYCSFDHSQPLKLKASFSSSGEMTSLPVSTTSQASEESPDLPSEQDLENLYQ
jgi:penicillin-binding protein 1A